MVERLRSFRAKDAELFETLVIASIDIAYMTSEYEARYTNLVRSIPTGPNGRAFLKIPDQRLWALRTAAHEFGEGATKIFLTHSLQEDRAREFRSLVTKAYKDDAEAARFLNTEVVSRLVAIDSPPEWDRIAWWVAHGVWPDPPGMHVGSGTGVTFKTRLAEPSSDDDADRFYVYRLVRFTPDLISADRALVTLWQQSYVEQRTAGTAPPGVSLPGLGLSLSAEAIVAGAAPALLLLQLIFLVHRERQLSIAAPDTDAFAFPSYACPSDPLCGPIPRTLAEAVQRFVWTLFLLLPTSLFSVGLLTRYDLLFPLGYFNGPSTDTFFKAEEQARAADMVSSVIDWVTFACIALSTLALLSITRQRLTPSDRPKVERAITIGGWIVAVGTAVACVVTTLWAFAAYIAPLANASDVPFRMQYLVGFGVLWSLFLGIACQRRARLVGLISLAGLAVFALHFVPF